MANNTGVKELLDLIANNPDLPIIAWVDGDIVADDSCNRWFGSFGSSSIIEYTWYEMYMGCEEVVYRDETERLEEYLLENTEMPEKEVEDYINNLPWTKAIAVNIDLLD